MRCGPNCWSQWGGVLIALAVTAPCAPAQIQRPEAARRVVRTWTFDDPSSGFEPVPTGWFRAQDSVSAGRSRPGYPSFNAAVLDQTLAHSGEFSIMLPTKGGNTAMQLSAGSLPAIPDADYLVSAQVRTRGLDYAKARLSAWLVNERREPIEGTRSYSDLVGPGDVWRPVEAALRGHADAAWIQIELELLQPATLPDRASGPRDVIPEDFHGAAWFDDLTVYQVPRIELSTASSVNIIESPKKPELTIFVRDLTGEPLRIDVRVFDMDGASIDGYSITMPMLVRRSRWTPALPRLGWYRAVMSVSGRQGPVGQRSIDFLWTSKRRAIPIANRREFGLIAENLPGPLHALLPDLVRAARTGAINLSVWDERTRPDTIAQRVDELGRPAGRLLELGQEVTFVLASAPAPLAELAHVDPDNPIPVLLADPDSWMPYLGPVFTKFGERVQRWQLGGTGANRPFEHDDLLGEVDRITKPFRRLVPRPRLVVPWGAEQRFPPDSGAIGGLTVTWPVGIHPEWIGDAVGSTSTDVRRRLVIETLPEDIYGRRASAGDLVRRAVQARAAGIKNLAIDSPWSVSKPDADQLLPKAELGVWRTLLEHLAGRQIVGKLPVTDGVQAYIIRGETSGALVAWNDSAPPERSTIQGYLGEDVVHIVDPFGNVRTSRPDELGQHAIPIGQMPVFIEGVDAELARFRASMRLDPPFLPARAEKHQLFLHIENPWNVTISGRIRISDPAQWAISPRVLPFNLVAGQSARLPIEVSFELGEEAGHRQMTVEVELVARRRYPIQRFPLELEIGLPTVDLITSYRTTMPGPGGRTDVIVSVRIINRSAEPQTFEAFAQAPGYARDFRPISQLEPGASTTRLFRFADGARRLKGKRVRIGLKEQDGTGRLNKTIRID